MTSGNPREALDGKENRDRDHHPQGEDALSGFGRFATRARPKGFAINCVEEWIGVL